MKTKEKIQLTEERNVVYTSYGKASDYRSKNSILMTALQMTSLKR